jgi:pimeloyl-ACP methyl ester carboxylesterase
VRNLLAQASTCTPVDWGNPSRTDRWLTIDDYVDDYLASCVEHICEAHGIDQVTLLGICEGGVFTTCYARCTRSRVRNLIVTITPIDFHADQAEGRADHGFINLWTRSLDKEDVARLIEANGNLPGELMSFVFSSMTPLADAHQVQPRHARRHGRREEAHELPAHGKVAAGPSRTIPAKAAKQWLGDLYQDNKLVKNQFVLLGPQGRASEHHDAGAQHLRGERPHHPAADLARAGGSRRHRRLHRDRPARRARGRIRERQVAGRARQGHHGLAARALVALSARRMPKIAPRFDDLPVLGPHGFTRIGYTEWGERNARRTVVCVHGLTRNSRDFDFLAPAARRARRARDRARSPGPRAQRIRSRTRKTTARRFTWRRWPR